MLENTTTPDRSTRDCPYNRQLRELAIDNLMWRISETDLRMKSQEIKRQQQARVIKTLGLDKHNLISHLLK